MTEKWNELIIQTEYDKWEELESFLYEKGFFSFELIDPRMELIKNEKGRWDFIEEDIFKGEFPGVTVKLYTLDNEEVESFRNLLEEIEKNNLGKGILNLIDDEDWKNNWKAFYSVQEIGEKIVIKPTWEDYENLDNRFIIELDPGMAFGTGGHETTKMCIEHLEKYLKPGDDVLDIGCGSGILSIAAKFLGANSVIGTDLDEKAVEISKENAKMNDVDVEFRVSDLFSNIDSKGDVVVANIVAEIVAVLISELDNYLNEGGIFISSGIINDKKNIVIDALEKKNYEILEVSNENEWVSIVARRNHA